MEMEQHVAALGPLVLGRPGVTLMTDLWSIGVGFALLPLRGVRRWPYALPGPLLALGLVILWPGLWGIYLVTLFATGLVMGAAMWLIAPLRKHTVLRGGALIVTAIVLLSISPDVPEKYQWLLSPLIPVVMFGVPVGVILVTEGLVERHIWTGPLLSSLCFAGAWIVWMARDYFQRTV